MENINRRNILGEGLTKKPKPPSIPDIDDEPSLAPPSAPKPPQSYGFADDDEPSLAPPSAPKPPQSYGFADDDEPSLAPPSAPKPPQSYGFAEDEPSSAPPSAPKPPQSIPDIQDDTPAIEDHSKQEIPDVNDEDSFDEDPYPDDEKPKPIYDVDPLPVEDIAEKPKGDVFTDSHVLSRKWGESLHEQTQSKHDEVDKQIEALQSKGTLSDEESQQLNQLMGKKKSLNIVSESAKLVEELHGYDDDLNALDMEVEYVKNQPESPEKKEDLAEARLQYKKALAAKKLHMAKVQASQVRMVEEVPPELRYHSKLGTPETLRAAAESPDTQVKSLAPASMNSSCVVFFAEMHDGSKAVYKPTKDTGLEKQRLKEDFIRESVDPNITEASRELALSKLDEMMGTHVVPVVAKVTSDDGLRGNGKGHLQQWVLGDMAWKVSEIFDKDVELNHPQIHQIAALDWLTGNTDRHMGNLMRGEDGQYYAIDNGLAWVKNSHTTEFTSEPIAKMMGKKVHKSVHEAIKRIDIGELAKTMKKVGFPPRDLAGFLVRKSILENKAEWPKDDNEWTYEWLDRSKKDYAKALEEAHKIMDGISD